MARVRSFAEEIVGREIGGEFIVVELTKDAIKPIYDDGGQLISFKTGAEAGVFADRRTAETGVKCQARRVQNDEWRKREETRLADGTYALLPWHDRPWWHDLKKVWGDHYPHVSVDKNAYIAFTEDAQKGAADIQTRMRPGRYLEKFLGEPKLLSGFVIRDLCTIFSKKFEDNRLLWANTPEEIEEVYTNGPSSCMSKEAKDYKTGGTHPTRMYGAGDIAVAYLRREGRIVARTLTFPEKKSYSPYIYGDKGRLLPLLQKEGYKEKLPFGARLTRHEINKDGKRFFVAPFVDGLGWVRVDGEFLRMGDKERMDDKYGLKVEGAVGLTEAFGLKCTRCSGEELPLRNTCEVRTTVKGNRSGGLMTWCQACSRTHAVQCPATGEYCDPEVMIDVRQAGRTRKQSPAVMPNTFVCAGSGVRHTVDEMVQLDSGEVWSREYFKKEGKSCEACGAVIKRRDTCGCSQKTLRVTEEQRRWS